MQLIKKLLLFALIVVVGVSGLYLASSKGWLNNTPLAHFYTSVNPETVQELSSATTDQTSILASRSSEVASQINQVLGTYIQENLSIGLHNATLFVRNHF